MNVYVIFPPNIIYKSSFNNLIGFRADGSVVNFLITLFEFPVRFVILDIRSYYKYIPRFEKKITQVEHFITAVNFWPERETRVLL